MLLQAFKTCAKLFFHIMKIINTCSPNLMFVFSVSLFFSLYNTGVEPTSVRSLSQESFNHSLIIMY